MRHLLVCPEYPPATHSGGIGTYTFHLGKLFADAGETLHVVCAQSKGTVPHQEVLRDGRLIIHRIPVPGSSEISRILQRSGYSPQSFSWEAAIYIERLLHKERIDVIESQEYQAPLFYFQLRRALGFGTEQGPPCFVHLHSPTELIARYNDWDHHHHFDWRFAGRLERFSMASADGLLSPSAHLANYAEEELALLPGKVTVIRYPMDEAPVLERDAKTWKKGSVLFVGRFEKRKGILEWIPVAANAASRNSQLMFEFVGGGKIEKTIRNLVPASLRSQFLFHGERNRVDLEGFLKRARMAVVPSRWENFPYACIEAMASGLPVLATVNGGMAEIIVDEQTGWVARKEGKEGLAEALERAVNTSPQRLADMGRHAAEQIRRVCNNQTVFERHHAFRKGLVQAGAGTNAESGLNMYFPELAQRKQSKGLLEQFIREQPVSGGKRAAEIIRRIKRKIKVPLPSAISQDVYRFLSRKW